MIDIYIHFNHGIFQGFCPRRAVWFGQPDRQRIQRIYTLTNIYSKGQQTFRTVKDLVIGPEVRLKGPIELS